MQSFSPVLLSIVLLLVNCSGKPPSNHKRAGGFFPPKIILQSTNGSFVRLSHQAPFVLIADAKKAVDADPFYWCELTNSIGALKSMHNTYVTVHLQKEDKAIARQNHIDSWERLTLQKKQNGIAFLAVNNKYLQPESSDYTLTASAETATQDCIFKMIPVP